MADYLAWDDVLDWHSTPPLAPPPRERGTVYWYYSYHRDISFCRISPFLFGKGAGGGLGPAACQLGYMLGMVALVP